MTADRRVVETADGRFLVDVVPTGYPLRDWSELGFLLLPVGWVRHRLLHRDEYTVVVLRQRKHGGIERIENVATGLDRATAETSAVEFAEDLARRA